jgi:hypothetical protein
MRAAEPHFSDSHFFGLCSRLSSRCPPAVYSLFKQTVLLPGSYTPAVYLFLVVVVVVIVVEVVGNSKISGFTEVKLWAELIFLVVSALIFTSAKPLIFYATAGNTKGSESCQSQVTTTTTTTTTTSTATTITTTTTTTRSNIVASLASKSDQLASCETESQL